MRFLFVLIPVAFFILPSMYSCKGKPDGINKPADSTALEVGDFIPTTAGSWWLYESTLGAQFKREATGIDTLKADLWFKYFKYTNMSSMDDDPEYFSKFDEKNYYTLLTFDSTDASYFKAVILIDSADVGHSWVNTGGIGYTFGEVDMEVNCEILSNSGIFSLPDTMFNNVIEMKATLYGKTALIPRTNCGTITYYFVRGIGVVKQVYNIDIRLGPIRFFEKKHTDVLIDYHIED